MDFRMTTMIPALALLTACGGSAEPEGTTTPPEPTDPESPVVTLADHTTPLCTPAPLTGTLPPGTGATEATLTIGGRSTPLELVPSADGAFTIVPDLLPVAELCGPSDAPCTLTVELTVLLGEQAISDDADLTLTDEGVLTVYVDADGDGYGADDASPELVCDATGYAQRQGDCDDTLDAVNEGITADACNGLDDDCDGGIDDDDPEGPSDGQAYYVDTDGDGAFVEAAAFACIPPGVEGVDFSPTAPAAGEEDCDDGDAGLNRPDLDLDGWDTCDGECNDADDAIHPGTTELVGSGIDEDCDGTFACYEDLDQDGYGSAAVALATTPGAAGACDAPTMGLADDATDCLDSDSQVHPGATELTGDDVDQDCNAVYACYVDVDGDGYGTPLTADFATPCGPTPGASAFDDDCDDTPSGAQRSPGHAEVPGNDVDEDCSLSYACYLDADDDGFAALGASIVDGPQPCDLVPGGAGASTPGTVGVDIDCNDGSTAFAPGLDDSTVGDPDYDCDGLVTCYLDEDDDNFGWFLTTVEGSVAPGGDCEAAPYAAPVFGDCDVSDPLIYPGAYEVPCDDIVQDCDRDWDAYVAILANPSGGFSPGDTLFDGNLPQHQLKAALDAIQVGDTVKLCGEETYSEGDFVIDLPITLEGDGAALRGRYQDPLPGDCDPDYGEEPVLTVRSGGTVTLKDLKLWGGCAGYNGGGGLNVQSFSHVEATDLIITGNATSHSGGGVAVQDSATLVLVGGEITDNHGEYAGGVYVDADATLHVEGDLTDFSIDGNSATLIGGGVRCAGTCSFLRTTISNNTAELYGGGVDAGHGSIVDFDDTTISGNTAAGGGGTKTQGTATYVDSTVSGNHATGIGGGSSASGTATFVNTTITDNIASTGGGIDVYSLGTVELVDSTLSNNSATSGGAVRASGTLSFDQVSLYGNTADEGNTVHLDGELATFTYTIAPGGNGDATPNIHCDTSGSTYSTTDPYTVCDDEICTP